MSKFKPLEAQVPEKRGFPAGEKGVNGPPSAGEKGVVFMPCAGEKGVDWCG